MNIYVIYIHGSLWLMMILSLSILLKLVTCALVVLRNIRQSHMSNTDNRVNMRLAVAPGSSSLTWPHPSPSPPPPSGCTMNKEALKNVCLCVKLCELYQATCHVLLSALSSLTSSMFAVLCCVFKACAPWVRLSDTTPVTIGHKFSVFLTLTCQLLSSLPHFLFSPALPGCSHMVSNPQSA